MSSDQKKVTFSVEQIDWLEQQFPELQFLPEASLGELQHAQGQRSVIHRIKQVSRVEARNVPIPVKVS
jgi:hypothetical protein